MAQKADLHNEIKQKYGSLISEIRKQLISTLSPEIRKRITVLESHSGVSPLNFLINAYLNLPLIYASLDPTITWDQEPGPEMRNLSSISINIVVERYFTLKEKGYFFNADIPNVYRNSLSLGENSEFFKEIREFIKEIKRSLLRWGSWIYHPKGRYLPSKYSFNKNPSVNSFNSVNPTLENDFYFNKTLIEKIFNNYWKDAIILIMHAIKKDPKSLANNGVYGKSPSSSKLSEILNGIYGEFNHQQQQKGQHKGIYYTPPEIVLKIFYYIFIDKINRKLERDRLTGRIRAFKKDWERFLETLLDQNKFTKHNYSADMEADNFIYLLETLYSLLTEPILDPSCGSGEFISGFISIWYNFLSYLLDYIEILIKNENSGSINRSDKLLDKIHRILLKNGLEIPKIIGIDIDGWALILSRFGSMSIIMERGARLLSRIRKISKNLNANTGKGHKIALKILSDLEILIKKGVSITLIENDFFNKDLQTYLRELNIKYIVGNPPFLRNRDIFDPYGTTPEDNITYRKTLNDFLFEYLSDNSGNKSYRIARKTSRMDLSYFFVLYSSDLLNYNGYLGFVLPDSWLYAINGNYMMDFLLTKTVGFYTIKDYNFRFGTPKIKTSILVVSLEESQGDNYNENIKSYKNAHFLVLFPRTEGYRPESPIHSTELVNKEISEIYIDNKSNYKYILIPYRILEKYRKERWGKLFIHTPSYLLNWMIEPKNNKLIPLSEIAIIRRGITTNCNDFFILNELNTKISDKNDGTTEFNTENYKNGDGMKIFRNGMGHCASIEREVLIPFIKSPRDITLPLNSINDVKSYLFYTDLSITELENKKLHNAINYIKYGEKAVFKIKKGTKRGRMVRGINSLDSFSSNYNENGENSGWYRLKKKTHSIILKGDHPIILIQKIYNTSYKVSLFDRPILCNNSLYHIILKKTPAIYKDYLVLLAFLLGAPTRLILEISGRRQFGGGAMDTSVEGIGEIPIPNPSHLNESQKNKILELAAPIFNMEFAPFEEEIKNESRIKFDKYLMSFYGINSDIHEIYKDILRLQSLRIRKKRL